MSNIVKSKLKAARAYIGKKEYENAYEARLASQNLGKIEESEKAYLRAIQTDPENILALQGISTLYESISDFEKLIPALSNLFNRLLITKNYTKSSEIFWKIINLYKINNDVKGQISLWKDVLSINIEQEIPESNFFDINEPTISGWPNRICCIDTLIYLTENYIFSETEKEIKRRRGRLDAPPLAVLTQNVKKEVTVKSGISEIYESKILSIEKENDNPPLNFKTLKDELLKNNLSESGDFPEHIFGERLHSQLYKDEKSLDLYEKIFEIYVLIHIPSNIKAHPGSEPINVMTVRELDIFQNSIIVLVSNSRNSKAHRFFLDTLDFSTFDNLFQSSAYQYLNLFKQDDTFYKALENLCFLDQKLLEIIKLPEDFKPVPLPEIENFSYGGTLLIRIINSKYYNSIDEFEKVIGYNQKITASIGLLEGIFNIKLNKTLEIANLELGSSYFGLGKSGWRKSKEIYTSCLQSNDINVLISSALGIFGILDLESKFSESVDFLRHILSKIQNMSLSSELKNKKVSLIKGKMGEAYVKLGNTSEAMDLIQGALELSPDWVEGKLALGDIYVIMYSVDGEIINRKNALKEYLQAAKLSQNNETPFIKLGSWYFDSYLLAERNFESDKSIENYKTRSMNCYLKAYSINPGNPIASKALVRSILADKSISSDEKMLKASQILIQTTKINKKQPWAWMQLGLINLNEFLSFKDSSSYFQNAIKNCYILNQSDEFKVNFISLEGLAESFLYSGKILSAQQAALKARRYLYTDSEYEDFISNFKTVSSEKIDILQFSHPVDYQLLHSLWSSDELELRRSSLSFLQGEIHSFKNDYNTSIYYYLESERISLSMMNINQFPESKLLYTFEKRKELARSLLARINDRLISNMLKISISKQKAGMFGSSLEYIIKSICRLSKNLEDITPNGSKIKSSPWKLIYDSSLLFFDSLYYYGNSAKILSNNSTSYSDSNFKEVFSSAKVIIDLVLDYYNVNVASSLSSVDVFGSDPITEIFGRDLDWLTGIREKLNQKEFEPSQSFCIDISLSLATSSSAMMVMISPSTDSASLAWRSLGNSYFLRNMNISDISIIGNFPFYFPSKNSPDESVAEELRSKTVHDIKNHNHELGGLSTRLLSDSFFCLQASLKLCPTSLKSLYLLSKVAFRLRMYKLSQHSLISSLILQPYSSYGWSLLGNLYMVLGYYDLSSKCFQNSLGNDPENLNSVYGSAVLNFFYLGSIKTSYELFKRSIDLGGSANIGAVLVYSALTWKYESFSSSQNISMAIFELRKLCEIVKHNPTCWYILGLLLEKSGEYSLSKDMFFSAYNCFINIESTSFYNFSDLINKYVYLGIADQDSESEEKAVVEISNLKISNKPSDSNFNNNSFKNQLISVINFNDIISENPSSDSIANFESVAQEISELLISQLQLDSLHGFARNCSAISDYQTANEIYSAILDRIDIDAVSSELKLNHGNLKLANILSIVVGYGKSLFLNGDISEGFLQFENALTISSRLEEVDKKFTSGRIIIDCMLSQVLWALQSEEHRKLAYKHIYESLYTDQNLLDRVLVLGTDPDLILPIIESIKVFLCFIISFKDIEAAKIALQTIGKIPFHASVFEGIPFLVSCYFINVEGSLIKARRNMEKHILIDPTCQKLWSQASVFFLLSSEFDNSLYNQAFLSSSSGVNIIFGKALDGLPSIKSSIFSQNLQCDSNFLYRNTVSEDKNLSTDLLLVLCFSGLKLGTSLFISPRLGSNLIWEPSRYYVRDNDSSQEDISTNLDGVSISDSIENSESKQNEDENMFDVYEKIELDASTIKKFASSNLRLAKKLMFNSLPQMIIKKSKFCAAKAVMLNPSKASNWYALSVASFYQILSKTNNSFSVPMSPEFLINTLSFKNKNVISDNFGEIVELCNTTYDNLTYWKISNLGLFSNCDFYQSKNIQSDSQAPDISLDSISFLESNIDFMLSQICTIKNVIVNEIFENKHDAELLPGFICHSRDELQPESNKNLNYYISYMESNNPEFLGFISSIFLKFGYSFSSLEPQNSELLIENNLIPFVNNLFIGLIEKMCFLDTFLKEFNQLGFISFDLNSILKLSKIVGSMSDRISSLKKSKLLSIILHLSFLDYVLVLVCDNPKGAPKKLRKTPHPTIPDNISSAECSIILYNIITRSCIQISTLINSKISKFPRDQQGHNEFLLESFKNVADLLLKVFTVDISKNRKSSHWSEFTSVPDLTSKSCDPVFNNKLILLFQLFNIVFLNSSGFEHTDSIFTQSFKQELKILFESFLINTGTLSELPFSNVMLTKNHLLPFSYENNAMLIINSLYFMS
ncbi:hypothetical protein AYI68_g4522 [Smittium mucronatum]|uniref:Superkiller protein 3 n=1 Tax=Smittium mucronatum TaxID=133383 RepID=A0A1R0GX07_9FUNG|nr:hypothetical protein AYI68_g4522 [Smittium mucronatum]